MNRYKVRITWASYSCLVASTSASCFFKSSMTCMWLSWRISAVLKDFLADSNFFITKLVFSFAYRNMTVFANHMKSKYTGMTTTDDDPDSIFILYSPNSEPFAFQFNFQQLLFCTARFSAAKFRTFCLCPKNFFRTPQCLIKILHVYNSYPWRGRLEMYKFLKYIYYSHRAMFLSHCFAFTNYGACI